MKKLLSLTIFFIISMSVYSQPVVYFDFVSHNEETTTWNGAMYYSSNRARLITLADYFYTHNITWNMQSDWRYLSNVLLKETPTLMLTTNNKNILRYMHEDKGVEMDPHAHESVYIYPDVVRLMDSIGLPESKIIGGSVYNDYNGINLWTNLINGQYGVIYPTKFWKPDFIMGGGTPNHIADLKYYGLWNPTDTNAYLVHNPLSPLHQIGVGCEMKIRDTTDVANMVAQLRQVITNVQTGVYPANGIYLQSIFFEQGDINNLAFYNKVLQVADSVNVLVQTGQAQWKTLKQVGDYWITTYNSQPYQWECGQIASAIEEKKQTNAFEIYPNPAGDVISIRSPYPISKLSISNCLGEEVNAFSGNITTIAISELPNGIYFINAFAESGVMLNKKIIVNR